MTSHQLSTINYQLSIKDMITDDNKKLAQWAMEYALKNGCQAAKLVLYTNSNSSFELRDGKMDRLQQSTENGLG